MGPCGAGRGNPGAGEAGAGSFQAAFVRAVNWGNAHRTLNEDRTRRKEPDIVLFFCFF